MANEVHHDKNYLNIIEVILKSSPEKLNLYCYILDDSDFTIDTYGVYLSEVKLRENDGELLNGKAFFEKYDALVKQDVEKRCKQLCIGEDDKFKRIAQYQKVEQERRLVYIMQLSDEFLKTVANKLHYYSTSNNAQVKTIRCHNCLTILNVQ